MNEDIDLVKELAEKGDAEAQFNLGVVYANGQGVERDEKEAVNWYSKAAEQDHPPAQLFLGLMYANGQGVERDEKEAVKWYSKAAGNWRFGLDSTDPHNAMSTLELINKKGLPPLL